MWKILAMILFYATFNVGFVWFTRADQRPLQPFKAVLVNHVRAEEEKQPVAMPTPQVETSVTIQATPHPITVPILTYHYIRIVTHPQKDPLGVRLSVHPAMFRQQLQYLKNNGFTVLRLEALDAALQGRSVLPPKPVVITFDDGYEDFYTIALPILKEMNMPATLFVVADFITNPQGRYVTQQQVEELVKTGLITIGVHTATHVDFLQHDVDLGKEIQGAKERIEHLVQKQLTTFAYPYGHYTPQVIDAVKQAGFSLAVSTEGGSRHEEATRYHLHRNSVMDNLEQFRKTVGN